MDALQTIAADVPGWAERADSLAATIAARQADLAGVEQPPSGSRAKRDDRRRKKEMIIVYYDSYVQSFFDDLVRFVSAQRNLLRKAKMAAKAAQLRRMAQLDMPDTDDDGAGEPGDGDALPLPGPMPMPMPAFGRKAEGAIEPLEPVESIEPEGAIEPLAPVEVARLRAPLHLPSHLSHLPSHLRSHLPSAQTPGTDTTELEVDDAMDVDTDPTSALTPLPLTPLPMPRFGLPSYRRTRDASPGSLPAFMRASGLHVPFAPAAAAAAAAAATAQTAVFDAVDRSLEAVQAAGERAAHAFLREGDCRADVATIQTQLEAARAQAAAELARAADDPDEPADAPASAPAKARSYRPQTMRRERESDAKRPRVSVAAAGTPQTAVAPAAAAAPAEPTAPAAPTAPAESKADLDEDEGIEVDSV